MKQPYATILNTVQGQFKVEKVGSQRWAFVNGNPISPTITEAWIAAGMIKEIRPSVWVKASGVVIAKT